MEARGSTTLPSEKAQRIVEAMRRSVASRGTARATFDHVAREAGVSRGLLHYYFGTKERLLAAVVRHDADLRMRVLEHQLHGALSADDFIGVLVGGLNEWVREEPESSALMFELFSLARGNAEIAEEFAALLRGTRELLVGVLAAKQEEGVLRCGVGPAATADVLLALGDGLALRMVGEPERDFSATIQAAVACVRLLLSDS